MDPVYPGLRRQVLEIDPQRRWRPRRHRRYIGRRWIAGKGLDDDVCTIRTRKRLQPAPNFHPIEDDRIALLSRLRAQAPECVDIVHPQPDTTAVMQGQNPRQTPTYTDIPHVIHKATEDVPTLLEMAFNHAHRLGKDCVEGCACLVNKGLQKDGRKKRVTFSTQFVPAFPTGFPCPENTMNKGIHGIVHSFQESTDLYCYSLKRKQKNEPDRRFRPV